MLLVDYYHDCYAFAEYSLADFLVLFHKIFNIYRTYWGASGIYMMWIVKCILNIICRLNTSAFNLRVQCVSSRLEKDVMSSYHIHGNVVYIQPHHIVAVYEHWLLLNSNKLTNIFFTFEFSYSMWLTGNCTAPNIIIF